MTEPIAQYLADATTCIPRERKLADIRKLEDQAPIMLTSPAGTCANQQKSYHDDLRHLYVLWHQKLSSKFAEIRHIAPEKLEEEDDQLQELRIALHIDILMQSPKGSDAPLSSSTEGFSKKFLRSITNPPLVTDLPDDGFG
jgi:hypothetical protein